MLLAKQGRRLGFVVALLLAALLTTLLVQTVRAAGVIGNGTAASCTEAALDAALVGGGLITFNCGDATTIVLTAPKTVVANTTIDGGNLVTLSGNDTTRLFFVNGVAFGLRNITLTRGFSNVGGGLIESAGAQITLSNVQLTSSYAQDQGGAIYCFVGTGGTLTISGSRFDNHSSKKGAAIYNDGCTLTVADTIFTNSEATEQGGALYNAQNADADLVRTSLSGNSATNLGGALYNDANAVLALRESSLSGNSARDGGGLFVAADGRARVSNTTIISNSGGYGGGIETSGILTVTDSLLSSNSVTGSGGGLWNLGGSLVMSRTSVISNTAFEGGGINSYGTAVQLFNVNVVGNTATGAGSGGGGIYHNAGTFFVTNATISGNRATAATGDGGGIYQGADDNMTLDNVTLSGNQAGRFGGGLYHRARFAILNNVTIGNNTAQAGDAIYEDAVVTPAAPGVVQIRNSVLFGSLNLCGGSMFGTLGNNIVAGTCGSIGHATDQTVSDAKMGPLVSNGGDFAMQTHLPLIGSPVINFANTASCTPRDQRGSVRVGTCDVGATEFDPTPPTPTRRPRAFLPLLNR